MEDLLLVEAVKILAHEFKTAFPDLKCLPLDLSKDISGQLFDQLMNPDFSERLAISKSKEGRNGPYHFKLESISLLVFIGSPFKKGSFTTIQNSLFNNIVADLSAGRAVDYGAIERSLINCVFENGLVKNK